VWHQYCDWYIEFVKPALHEGGTRAAVARAVLLEVLGILLRLLHPMMPFITEELWHRLPGGDSYIGEAKWPQFDESKVDDGAERAVELLQKTVVKVRNLRAESNIDPSSMIEVLLQSPDRTVCETLQAQKESLALLVRAAQVRFVDAFEEKMVAARGTTASCHIAIPLAGLLDLDAERKRLRKELGKVERELHSCGRKLGNHSFLEKAPHEVVEKERRLHLQLSERREKLERHLASLDQQGA
jgi:valyl-tRNA synthetase